MIMRAPAAQPAVAPKSAAPPPAAPAPAKAKSGFPVVPALAVVAVLAASGAGAWFFLRGSTPVPKPAPPAIIPPPIQVPPHSETAPPPQSPADPVKAALAVNQALSQVRCTLSNATPTSSGIAISGLAGAGGPEARLHQAAAASASGLDTVWSVKAIDGPYCTVLDTIRGTPGAGAPILAIKEDATHLVAHTHLHTIVSGLDFPAYVRVDYLSSDGSLTHLYPQVRDAALSIAHDDPSVLLPAGAALKLGYLPHWVLSAEEPFGTDMILVSASTEKLLADSRPNTEPGARYLAALRDALLHATAAGARTASAVITLNTSAK